jgi:hypothetical protein
LPIEYARRGHVDPTVWIRAQPEYSLPHAVDHQPASEVADTREKDARFIYLPFSVTNKPDAFSGHKSRVNLTRLDE